VKTLTTGRHPILAWVGALALAASLVVVPGTVQAQGRGGHGGARGGHSSWGGQVRYKSGGSRGIARGGSSWGRGTYRGGSSWGRRYVRRSPSARYRGPSYYVGPRYGRTILYPRYYRTYPRRYYDRPSFYLGFGLGFGYPYHVPYGAYCPYVNGDYDSYPRVVERTVVVHDRSDVEDEPGPSDSEQSSVEPAPGAQGEAQVQVGNYPPDGCYYFDSYCGREFADLDDYTAHLEANDHGRTIEVIERATKEHVRTLVYNGDYWSVQN